MTSAIPSGYHSLTPHLVIDGANEAIAFYKKAFGAEQLELMPSPDGKVLHCTLKIFDSNIMLCDPMGDAKDAKALSGSPVCLHLFVEDVDKVYEQAIAAGAKETMPIFDAFWGDRYGKLEDPFGHSWSVATRKENLSPEQIAIRGLQFFMGNDCD